MDKNEAESGRTRRLCVFGEVLYDHFPDGTKVLGGAPFNVAWHLQAFGSSPLLISRVGADDEGESVRRAMRNWGMDLSGLQTDPQLQTGRVRVTFTENEPRYEIVHPAAFDAIETPVPLPACRVLYHGSLALRDPAPNRSLEQIRSAGGGTIFVDVNLRPPWWDRQRVLSSVSRADWVKLNQDELFELCPDEDSIEGAVDRFMQRHELEGLLLTHGSQGAELLTRDGSRDFIAPAGDVPVIDTVGAGDAFTSVMILGLDRGWPPEISLKRAQDFASAIVRRRGATVDDLVFYRQFIENWN